MYTELSKSCTKCCQVKFLSLFSSNKNAKDGKQSHCKSCVAEKHRFNRKGSPCKTCGNPKEYGVPKGARLCLTCSETCHVCHSRPKQKQHRACNVCTLEKSRSRIKSQETLFRDKIVRVSSKYKVTKEQATELVNKPNCSVCNKQFAELRDKHIDHCHSTGKVRDVLCFNCNAALGHVNDNKERLLKLVDYIQKHKNRIEVEEEKNSGVSRTA